MTPDQIEVLEKMVKTSDQYEAFKRMKYAETERIQKIWRTKLIKLINKR